MSDRMLKAGEVAALFRVDPKTVTRWASAGKLSHVKTPGGHARFRESYIHALLEDEDTSIPEPEEAPFIPGEPFIAKFGPRIGYVVGECRHAVAQIEWNAGLRKCERC